MADVSSTLRAWSTTPGNNNPQGSTSIGTGLDDNLREIQKVVRQYLAATASNMASAATVDLSTADGFYVQITGTTTITAFGTEASGIHYLLKFAGALTLTHNATSLILPGGASITTVAGDLAWVISEGSGNWRCLAYLPASTSPGGVPAGTILDFGGTAAPTGFLGCDGSAVSRTTFARLFAVVGTTWGVGDGSTTFNLPNFQRRAAVGSGGSGTATLANSVGSTGGAETHTLVSAEVPATAVDSQGAHSHTETGEEGGGNGTNRIVRTSDGPVAVNTASGNSTSSDGAHTHTVQGGGGAHNNLQPSAVVLKIIKT